jgi:flagellar basal-body rod protein FlgB
VVSIIDSSTTGLLGLALDAATMRQQAIAHNIANAGTAGYQRIGVSFEQQLAGLSERGANRGPAAPSLADLSNARPAFEYAAGGAVSLDVEMAQLSETTVHHQALLKALNRHFALIGMAINEGKR